MYSLLSTILNGVVKVFPSLLLLFYQVTAKNEEKLNEQLKRENNVLAKQIRDMRRSNRINNDTSRMSRDDLINRLYYLDRDNTTK